MEDLEKTCIQIDALLMGLLHFVADDSPCPYRVVFDVEGPDDPIFGYPMIVNTEWAKAILSPGKASIEWFKFMVVVAKSSLSNCGFPDDVLDGICYLAAVLSFGSGWESINISDYELPKAPEMYSLLYRIYEKHVPTVIPEALGRVREALRQENEAPDYFFMLFCTRVSTLTMVDYSMHLRHKDCAVHDNLRKLEDLDAEVPNLDSFKLGIDSVASFSTGLPL
jgi:hypothetical protein